MIIISNRITWKNTLQDGIQKFTTYSGIIYLEKVPYLKINGVGSLKDLSCQNICGGGLLTIEKHRGHSTGWCADLKT